MGSHGAVRQLENARDRVAVRPVLENSRRFPEPLNRVGSVEVGEAVDDLQGHPLRVRRHQPQRKGAGGGGGVRHDGQPIDRTH